MKSKQKLRNTNQFKKKKNKQKNQKKPLFQFLFKGVNPPKKVNIKHYPETVNFRKFIGEMEENFKSESIEVIKTELKESEIQTTFWNGDLNKWEVNETINSKRICYESELFGLVFTPFKQGVQLFKISINPLFHGKGIGKEIMRKILQICEKLNIEISLIPIPYQYNIPIEKLKKFYKNLGFEKELFSPYWINTSNNIKQFERENLSMVA